MTDGKYQGYNNIEHYVLECRRYKQQRKELIENMAHCDTPLTMVGFMVGALLRHAIVKNKTNLGWSALAMCMAGFSVTIFTCSPMGPENTRTIMAQQHVKDRWLEQTERQIK